MLRLRRAVESGANVVASSSRLTVERLASIRGSTRSIVSKRGTGSKAVINGQGTTDRLLINWALRNGIAPATRDKTPTERSRSIPLVGDHIQVDDGLEESRALTRRRGRSHAGRFVCNEDPDRLIEWYKKMGLGDLLGQRNVWGVDEDGHGMGWRAVTHKSWGHGIVDNQERLRYIGRRLLHAKVITELHMALIKSSATPTDNAGLQSSISTTSTLLRLLTSTSLSALLDPTDSLANMARRTEMDKLIRWNPSYLDDMRLSGVRRVQGETVEAVLGTIWHVGGQKRAEDWTMTWIWPELKIPKEIRELTK